MIQASGKFPGRVFKRFFAVMISRFNKVASIFPLNVSTLMLLRSISNARWVLGNEYDILLDEEFHLNESNVLYRSISSVMFPHCSNNPKRKRLSARLNFLNRTEDAKLTSPSDKATARRRTSVAVLKYFAKIG